MFPSNCKCCISDQACRWHQWKIVVHSAIEVISASTALLARERVLMTMCGKDARLQVCLQVFIRPIQWYHPRHLLPITDDRHSSVGVPFDTDWHMSTVWSCAIANKTHTAALSQYIHSSSTQYICNFDTARCQKCKVSRYKFTAYTSID